MKKTLIINLFILLSLLATTIASAQTCPATATKNGKTYPFAAAYALTSAKDQQQYYPSVSCDYGPLKSGGYHVYLTYSDFNYKKTTPATWHKDPTLINSYDCNTLDSSQACPFTQA